jgi:Tfp pilus assembly protein PilN
MSETVVAALVGGIAGVLAALLPIILASRRAPSRKANDTVALVNAQTIVAERHTKEINRLEKKNAALEKRNDILDARVGKLEMALRAAGIDPAGII